MEAEVGRPRTDAPILQIGDLLFIRSDQDVPKLGEAR